MYVSVQLYVVFTTMHNSNVASRQLSHNKDYS